MVKCGRCGVEIADSFDICPNCGNNLAESQTSAKSSEDLKCPSCGESLKPNAEFCSKCGTPIDEGHKFCRKCGTPVKSMAAPSQQHKSGLQSVHR